MKKTDIIVMLVLIILPIASITLFFENSTLKILNTDLSVKLESTQNQLNATAQNYDNLLLIFNNNWELSVPIETRLVLNSCRAPQV